MLRTRLVLALRNSQGAVVWPTLLPMTSNLTSDFLPETFLYLFTMSNASSELRLLQEQLKQAEQVAKKERQRADQSCQ